MSRTGTFKIQKTREYSQTVYKVKRLLSKGVGKPHIVGLIPRIQLSLLKVQISDLEANPAPIRC